MAKAATTFGKVKIAMDNHEKAKISATISEAKNLCDAKAFLQIKLKN